MTGTALDRSRPPEAGPVRPSRFPDFSRRRLAGGLTLLTLRRRSPLVALKLLFPAGAANNRPADAGLAPFTAMLLDEGTRRSTALEIAARIERLGGDLTAGAGWDAAQVSTTLLAEHVGAGLELTAEVAAEPRFDEAEIERLRRQRIAELLRVEADPAHQAWERFYRTVYDGAPYGTTLKGTRETVSRFQRDEVVGFYRRHYGRRGAIAIAVGDVEPERVAATITAAFEAPRAFGAAGSAPDDDEPPAAPEVVPVQRRRIAVHVVDRPAAAQTQLLAGHAGIPRAHPDYLPAALMTTLLGGKFTSRINLNLRERNGFTYGAYCQLQGRLGPGPLTVTTSVANPVAGAAVREILAELHRIRDEPVTAEELDDTRSYMIGVFPYTLQQLGDLSARLEILAVYGLPDDYYDHYPRELAAVDAERVQEVARRYLHPERLVIVAVGPAAELVPQLEGLGASPEVHTPG